MKQLVILIATLGLLAGCGLQSLETASDGRPGDKEAPKPTTKVATKMNDLNKIQALIPDGDIKRIDTGYWWVVRRPDGSVWAAYTGDTYTVTTNLLFGPIIIEDRVKL